MNDTVPAQGAPPEITRDEIISRLRANAETIHALHATALYLYGAAAGGELASDEVIDVFVDYDLDGPFSFVEWVQGGEVLEGILGRKVNFTTRNGLDRRVRAEIEQSAVRVL